MAIINIAIGFWLFISAFAWQHSALQQTNTWIVGVVCTAVGALSVVRPQLRYANSALALWLFISAFWLPVEMSATRWNNALFAMVLFAVSLARPLNGTDPKPARRAAA